MNLRSSASNLWHDALSTNVKAIDPRHQIGFATKDRGLDEMEDHVIAGYIQGIIARLDDHLQKWGHLCWAPEAACPFQAFDTVHTELLTHYALAVELRGDRAKYGSRIDRMADIAITQMVHLNRTNNWLPSSEAAFSRHLGIDKSNYNRGGYSKAVAEMSQILSTWTSQALRPIIKFKFKELELDIA